MKGATDGGLDVPHNEKRFPGYDRDAKSYDVSCDADFCLFGSVAARDARVTLARGRQLHVAAGCLHA